LTKNITEIQSWIDVNDKHEEVNIDEVTEPKDALQRQYEEEEEDSHFCLP